LDRIDFRQSVKDDLTKMWNYEKYGQPFKKGGYYFFYKNDGLQNQSVLYYQKGLKGKPEVFIDPNLLNESGTASLGSLSFSKNHTYCAYSVSQAGSDWQDIYVMNVNTKEVLTDIITYTKFTNVAWAGENGFYYSGYDKPKNEDERFSAKTEFQKIFFHVLGTDIKQDKLVYEDRTHALRYKGVSITDDERWLLLYQSEGTDGSQIDYVDLAKTEVPNVGSFKTLLPGFEYNYNIIESIDGKFLMHTNHGADNYYLVLVDPNLPPTPNAWQQIVAEKNEKLDEVSIVGGSIFCKYLKDASSMVMQYDLKGKWIRTIELPGIGTASGFNGDIKDDHTFYTFSSFNYPPTIFKYDIATGKSELFKKPTLGFRTDNIKVTQVFVESNDMIGQKVPMFIVHRSDVSLAGDKQHPVLMYGYGGFNISLTPSFSIINSYFVQQGGIYVMVNLPGGSEYGETWHSAGNLENKQNVFDAFIAAGEYLIKEQITTKDQLAISGRSNGGLLVGACMTQRPDLFKVALPGVGVLDMLRYHKFTVGWGWVVEYGSSENKTDFDYLIKYSPLHNLKKGTDYPATMITTADHDDRVVPAHSFKFAATLQEMNSGKKPALIRIDKQAGHGAGKPTAKVIDEWGDILSFTMYHLGMKPQLINK
jgi:prolyl oligopeptidase